MTTHTRGRKVINSGNIRAEDRASADRRRLGIVGFCVTMSVLGISSAEAQDGIQLSHVSVQAESGAGLESSVLIILRDGSVERLGRTDSLGILELTPSVVSQPGDRVQGVPFDYEYYSTPKEEVRSEMTLTAILRGKYRSSGVYWMVPNNYSTYRPERWLSLLLATTDGNAAGRLIASLAYSEFLLEQRRFYGSLPWGTVDDLELRQVQLRIYIAASELLGVDKPMVFDDDLDVFAPSAELVDAIRAFQGELSLELTGFLDPATVGALVSPEAIGQ